MEHITGIRILLFNVLFVVASVSLFVGVSFFSLQLSGFGGWFLACLIVAGLLSVILWSVPKLHEAIPQKARLIGNIIFWFAIEAVVICVGLAAYAVYIGASAEGGLLILVAAVIYWALGWSICRILTPSSSKTIGTTPYRENYSYLMDEH